jgi:hypothetical protein
VRLGPCDSTRKADEVPQQVPRRGIRAAEALGLTIFVATVAFLSALLVTWILKVPDDFPQVALVFSTACGVAAAFGMLWDAVDLWLRGRRMSPRMVKNVRMMVWVGVLGALATSILGQNTMIVLYLAPAMVTYLFISRRVPAGSAAQAAARSGAGGRSSSVQSGGGTYKGRQRRGGKKRR